MISMLKVMNEEVDEDNFIVRGVKKLGKAFTDRRDEMIKKDVEAMDKKILSLGYAHREDVPRAAARGAARGAAAGAAVGATGGAGVALKRKEIGKGLKALKKRFVRKK